MSSPNLRGYQSELCAGIDDALKNPATSGVLAVLPTGGGKTVVFSNRIAAHDGPVCATAHRQELVQQISKALAREGVLHNIIAPKPVIKKCVEEHMRMGMRSFYNPSSSVAVAGVDTLIRFNGDGEDGDLYYQHVGDKLIEYGPRTNGRWGKPRHFGAEKPKGVTVKKVPPKDRDASKLPWLNSVTLNVMDEAHHVLRENKWGRACKMFPNAKLLGVTATPIRADGKGLGSHADGLFDVMIQGPTMRQLINLGYLTDYRIVAPVTKGLDWNSLKMGSTGDYTKQSVSAATKKSEIVGDVVSSYLQFAKGKRGVTFATDLEDAHQIAEAFNASGVPAAVVHGASSDEERNDATRGLASGKYLQLVNVDLFGEGFDLPAIEVVSMARPTASLSLFIQQFGRALRLMIDEDLMRNWENFSPEERKAHIAQSTKPKALIIDHVANIGTPEHPNHGLPDAERIWSLDAREKRGRSNVATIPTVTCLQPTCLSVYEKYLKSCPFCGHTPVPADRSGPEKVDGDLTEVDPDVLERMRGQVKEARLDVAQYAAVLKAKHLPDRAIQRNCKHHLKKQEPLKTLDANIAWWAGTQYAAGRTESEAYRLFFYKFGMDVLTAQALNANDATVLAAKICEDIAKSA